MSFQIFLMTTTEDERDNFDRAIVERAFKDIAVRQDNEWWQLQTPEGDEVFATVHVHQKPRLSGFSVIRPPSFEVFPTFWDAVFDVLRQTRTVLAWPGGPPPYCVANPALVPDLPADLIEAWGNPPPIVSSGADIVAAMERSGI